VAHEQLHELDSAAACYGLAGNLVPCFARSHWRLGLVLLDRGYFEPAIEAQGKAYSLEPTLRTADRRLF
jgi:hypothetical protein